jgi:putative acetyltransferase
MPTPLTIRQDPLEGLEIRSLLARHLALMAEVTPAESIHALDLSGLRVPDVTAWTAWRGSVLLGCGALKQLDPAHGEIKSMHTAAEARRQGVGAAMLRHILDEARSRGYRRLSLETGAMPAFAPARALYAGHGFAYCGPFGEYREDPNSVFMTLALGTEPGR